MRLSALVENRWNQTLAIRPRDVTLEVYFVTIEEFDRSSFISQREPSNVYPYLDSYDRYHITLDDASIENGIRSGAIWTVAPGAESFLEVAASQQITSPSFAANTRGRPESTPLRARG